MTPLSWKILNVVGVSCCHDSLLNGVVGNDSYNCANFINSSDKLFSEAVKSKEDI